MNLVRPIVGAVLATLMLSPMFAPVLTPVLAAEVELLPPGGGLPPIDGTGPVDGLAPPDTSNTGPAASDNGRESSSSSSYAEEPTLQTRHFGLNIELSCAVSGTPNAIVVVNRSAEPLPVGTRIKWQLKGEGKRGFFALLSPLPGGETLVADNVLDGAADQAAACVARVI